MKAHARADTRRGAENNISNVLLCSIFLNVSHHHNTAISLGYAENLMCERVWVCRRVQGCHSVTPVPKLLSPSESLHCKRLLTLAIIWKIH
jgi:hypothetical protein